MWESLQQFMQDNPWVGWAGAGVILAAAELISMDFVLVMLALGAFGGAVGAAIGAPFVLSLLVAIVISVGLLGVLRPNLVARMHGGPELLTGHAALVGGAAVVVDEVTDMAGTVRLSGEIWTARAYDPHERIEPGTKVRVFEIDGATAVVHPD